MSKSEDPFVRACDDEPGRPASQRCSPHVNATSMQPLFHLSRSPVLQRFVPRTAAHCTTTMASSSYASEALAGFANGSLYDQYRPSYSEESVTKLLQALRVDGASQATILDLAAGTGKFTSLLAQRREQFHVIAVEPNRGMQEELKKKHLQRVKVSDGLATKIPVYDGSVDAVIAAQVS